MKFCNVCKTTKKLSEFGERMHQGKVITRSECRECKREYNRQWRKSNSDYTRPKPNPHRSKWKEMLYSAKARAKRKGIPFEISFQDVHRPMRCPIFDVEINYKEGPAGDYTPSLDRIIPELGYVKGNVVVISNKANRMKSNGTLEECVKLGAWAKKLLTE